MPKTTTTIHFSKFHRFFSISKQTDRRHSQTESDVIGQTNGRTRSNNCWLG